MRRTEQEFKAELMRRAETYRAIRKQRRKKLLTTALCMLIVAGGWGIVSTVGGDVAGKDAAAEAPMEEMLFDGVNFSNGAAVQEAEPAEVNPESGAGQTFGSIAAESRVYDVISLQITREPASDAEPVYLTDRDQIVPILVTMEKFFIAPEQECSAQDAQTVYSILVEREHKTELYMLCGDCLISEAEGWCRYDPEAAGKLMELIIP